jgi:hypothetical protein
MVAAIDVAKNDFAICLLIEVVNHIYIK